MSASPPGVPPDVPADVDLDRAWLGVAAGVWRRRPGTLERLAGRALRSPGLARALLTTPSLLLPWLLASVVVLGAGAAATMTAGQPMVALLAPGLSGIAISYAYGPGVDPAWELSRSMAVSDQMVLLTRALAVFALNAVLGVAAAVISSLATPSGVAAAITFGWLLPMTAVCALSLAAATVARSAVAGAAAGLACWAIMVLSGLVAGGRVAFVFTQGALIVPYLIVAAAGIAIATYASRTPRGMAR